MRVFVADDSWVVRRLLASILSLAKGVENIGEASDALEAIECVRRLRPEAAILDIQMPKGSGIDVLKAIRHYELPTKVIMLTNYPYPQYRLTCMAERAEFLLTNPPNCIVSHRYFGNG